MSCCRPPWPQLQPLLEDDRLMTRDPLQNRLQHPSALASATEDELRGETRKWEALVAAGAVRWDADQGPRCAVEPA